MPEKKLTFEQALKQLEMIAEQIERGQIGLEESIAKYEEGMALVRQCREILAKAELKIQRLQQGTDGTLETSAFAREDEQVLSFDLAQEEGSEKGTSGEGQLPPQRGGCRR